MDRRGFVTAGMTAGLAGVSGAGGALGSLLAGVPGWGPGKTLPDGTIRLSSNENPLGLSPRARQAVIDAIPVANRYPSDAAREVEAALARQLGTTPDHVILGAGSTEVLQMAVQAYQSPHAPMVVAEPTFEDVPRYQRPFAYDMVAVPLLPDMSHDLGRMREVAEKDRRPSVVYVCNPNNPTGTVTPSAELNEWIADAPETTMFLVDEAYFEYVDDPRYTSALPLVDAHPNVIVVRTFSKIFGMAGLRLGYGVAHPGTIGRLRDFISSNNANVLASHAALASLGDQDLVARSVAVNDAAKQIAHATLDELSLEYLPTQTNFIMHRIHGDLGSYIGRMRDAGIRVGRPFPPMLGWNRVSFGLPEEMERWAETLRGFRERSWM
ncbi:MAG: aminotransferase class I/II-fold pyridoxal phosphate-dependent enzyme [Gemmatimonadota bacterium]|nr:aminotransferase class I/II-fold pyridoxal phosphate-dependent enzyme [Gemmatimonadota bacterium]MDH5760522.1 aminotransferase class I/II-fold pyridoxal phosphate-dependent enzyme [Gemmatimonadota bacterium]